MVNRTKIVCTLGPAVNTQEKIEELILAGMNVARLNFSHGSHEEHGKRIEMVKKAREKLKRPIAIMLDTKGPEIRLGTLEEENLILEEGQKIWFCKEACAGNREQISLTPPHALEHLEKDMFILLNDGYIITHVVAIEEGRVCVEVDHGGIIRSGRGVNIPGAEIDLPAMTDQDVVDIRFGCAQDVDLISASFVRSAEHVLEIKELLKSQGKGEIQVVAKIENSLGVQNFDAIVAVADGIMVARGDLGVELPLTQVPRLQKMMIRKSFQAGKPAVTATQMLESMIHSPRPTRAEASDVANAIYDSSSAVMLSGETAMGDYPLKTVETMGAIISETEDDFNYYEFFKQRSHRIFHDVPSSVGHATVRTAYGTNAKAIFVFTTGGSSVRHVARLRPEMPIIALTHSQKVYHQLALNWGVVPLFCPDITSHEQAFQEAAQFALKKGFVQSGDLVVFTAGTHFGTTGSTNMMVVETIQ